MTRNRLDEIVEEALAAVSKDRWIDAGRRIALASFRHGVEQHIAVMRGDLSTEVASRVQPAPAAEAKYISNPCTNPLCRRKYIAVEIGRSPDHDIDDFCCREEERRRCERRDGGEILLCDSGKPYWWTRKESTMHGASVHSGRDRRSHVERRKGAEDKPAAEAKPWMHPYKPPVGVCQVPGCTDIPLNHPVDRRKGGERRKGRETAGLHATAYDSFHRFFYIPAHANRILSVDRRSHKDRRK